MNLFNLLEATTETVDSTSKTSSGGGLFGGSTMIIWIVAIVLLVVFFFMSSRSRKKQMKAMEERFNTIAVGDKVITIGYIVGYIVEILPDNCYVLKTGSEENVGYVTVAQKAIYQFFKPEELVDQNQEPFAEDSASTENERTDGEAQSTANSGEYSGVSDSVKDDVTKKTGIE